MELIRSAENIMDLTIELEQEEDGRWIAEVIDIPGVLAYGQTRNEAVLRVKALALRVLADQILEQDDRSLDFTHIVFVAAA
jgi:predicted RNase H-like HicB family nuclease